MNVEKIHEPIQVLALCKGGAIEPLRFLWGTRTYRVQAVNGRWVDRSTSSRADSASGNYALHYSVQCDCQTFFIHFSSEDVHWWLDEVVVE